MLARFYPKQLAARRFERQFDHVVAYGAERILPTTYEQSVLPDCLPDGVEIANIPTNRLVALDASLGIEENQPRGRVIRFMLFNSCGAKDHPLRTAGGTTLDQVKVPTFYLEQRILAAGTPYKRLIDGSATATRPANSAPCIMAQVDGIAAKLSMKQAGLDSLTLRREYKHGGWRTSTGDTLDGDIGWAASFAESTFPFNHDTVDGPNQSMNNANMWDDPDAPMIRMHLAHTSDPVGHTNFTKDPNTRSVDRYWNKGATDDNKSEVYTTLHDVVDKMSYADASVAGVLFGASPAGDPSEGDSPDSMAPRVIAAATGAHLEQAIRIAWRCQLLTAFAAANPEAHLVNGSLDIPLADVWFEGRSAEQIDVDVQSLRVALFSSSCSLFADTTTKYVWSELEEDESCLIELSFGDARAMNGFASVGSASLTQGEFFAISAQAAAFKYRVTSPTDVTSVGPVPGYNSDAAYACRPMLGQSDQSGSWIATATGLSLGVSGIAASSTGYDTHLATVPRDSSGVVLSTTGMIAEPTIGTAAPLLAGYYLGVVNNGVTALFEDEVEADVSDWDDGGSFFTLFFVNQGEN